MTTTAPVTALLYDRDEVIRTLNLFVGKGNIAEIRILNAFGSKGRNDAGYFDNFSQAAGMLKMYASSPKNPGIYFVLNPFDPELMARAANRFQERATETTQDVDVKRRRWFFIDCDPKRKTGISSTEQEWNAAKQKAEQVRDWLATEFSFPEPIFCSSGNGFHLHYKIDCQADDEGRDLVKKCLRAIAAKFDDDAVTIDTKVFNAARICKLYGTMARKGDHTENRPHRMSQILSVPDNLECVSEFVLLELSALAPPEKVRTPVVPDKKPRKGKKTPADRARAYLAKVPGAVAGSSGHDWTYHAACLLIIDFGLSIEDAMPLMQEWNETCQPPWSDSELVHKLESADALPDERGAALKSDREKWEQGVEAKLAARAEAVAVQTDEPDSTPVAVPADPLAYDRKILKELGIVYCCETDNSEIEVFSNVFRKFSAIRDSGKLTYSKLLQIAGPPAMRLVAENSSEEGKQYNMSSVRNALAIVAGDGKRGNEKLGQGIWRLGDKIVIVNGGHLAIYDGSSLTQEFSAVYRDHVFELGSHDEWFDFEAIKGWISQPNRDWIFEAMLQLCRILEQWSYSIPDKTEDPAICAEVLASLIVASFIQSFWTFRPMTFLIGESNCGKSTLFDLLIGDESDPLDNGLMGQLAVHSADQSAAGIRQAVERSSRPVVIDELEKSKHRKEILSMIRGASRGSQTIRGSASQSGAVKTKLAFMAWAASTESGIADQADKNRWIMINMVKPKNSQMGKLKLPDVATLDALRDKLIAASVVIAEQCRNMIQPLVSRRPADMDHRIATIFAVPASIFAAMAGLPIDPAVDSYHRMLRIFDTGELISDHENAMDVILTSKVRAVGGERSLQSLIQQTQDLNRSGSIENEELLASNGVRVFDDEVKTVFMNPKVVSRELLKGSSLDGVKIDELILRIPGVTRTIQRINGKPMRGLMIPLSVILPGAISNPEEIVDPFLNT